MKCSQIKRIIAHPITFCSFQMLNTLNLRYFLLQQNLHNHFSAVLSTTSWNTISCKYSGCFELTDLYCFVKNIPSLGTSVFKESYVEYATLHVPASSVNAYKTADQWKEFGTIVGFDPTAVEEVKSNKTIKANENAPIFDLMGRRLQQKPASGYYIQGGKKFFVK